MSTYAALVSLLQILRTIVDSGREPIYNSVELQSIYEKVILLLDFLENSTFTYEEASQISAPETKMREAAYKAEDVIESQKSRVLDGHSKGLLCLMNSILYLFLCVLCALINKIPETQDLRLVLNDLDVIVKDVIRIEEAEQMSSYAALISLRHSFLSGGHWIPSLILMEMSITEPSSNPSTKEINSSERPENEELCLIINDLGEILDKIKDACGNPSNLAPAAASSSSRRGLGGTGKNVTVGLESDIEQIKARFLQHSSEREFASIVGMGGIGKTTLARLVYHDPDIVYHFDILAWVTVSQEYSLRHVLLDLLDSAKILTREMQEDDDNKLCVYLYQNLMGRRYLIVMDDVWDTQIWDSISIYFPQNDNGSRVLLTSRLLHVARYPDSRSPIYQMQCLNESDSWSLLRQKVFGDQGCPSDLESIGREIARNCRGLPLAIVVTGGLLCKDNQKKIWRDVADNLKLRQTEEECVEILGLSYKHLPHYLRPCFLYMGVFLGDSEILASKLISLWAAEGFLEPHTSKSLEEVAEDYLNDLIGRNLISVCKRSCNGKIRTCSIHDLLRDVCVQNAQKENFLEVVDWSRHLTGERHGQTPRRLSIYLDAVQDSSTHDLISCYYNVRSLLCSASKLLNNPSVVYLGFLYLRVLDVVVVHFTEFPDQILKLIHLRYLAFHYDGSIPPSISKLENLETLLVHHHCSYRKYPLLPWVIWSMANLRHIYVKPGCDLSNRPGFRLPWKSSNYILQHLQTLVGVKNFKWSKGIIKRLPNVKKLVISYHVSSLVDWSEFQLESLVNLHQLETLKITIKYHDIGSAISNVPPKLAFPQKLKKLSLSGCGISWASMTTIGSLPNLKALKLRHEACSGPAWQTVEGEFPQLIFLLLEEISLTCWETDAAHFPHLQRLVIRSCGMLEEIPYAIGYIPTLEMIELVDCLPSAVDSAKEIKEEQESMGNDDLKIRIGLTIDVPELDIVIQ